MRTGKHKDNLPMELKKGDILEICTDSEFEGEEKKVGCSYEQLPRAVMIGEPVIIHYGKVEGVVSEIEDVSLFLLLTFNRNA